MQVGPTLPIGGFASEDADNIEGGGANLGVGLGLQYNIPITETGLSIFSSIDFSYNTLKNSVKQSAEKELKAITNSYAVTQHYSYINVPFSLGLQYHHSHSEKLGIILMSGLTLNTLKITDMKLEAAGQVEVVSRQDLSNNFGFKAGFGLLFNERVQISVQYLGLGVHDISGDISVGGNSNMTQYTQTYKSKLAVQILSLNLGFSF